MKVGVIGSGVFGLAIANLLLNNKNDVCIWTEKEDPSEIIIPDDLDITNDYEEIIKDKDIVFILTSSKYVPVTLENIKNYISPNVPVVLGSKGLLEDGTRLSEVLKEKLPNNPSAIISGPGFAKDVYCLEPVGFTIATEEKSIFEMIKKCLSNTTLEYSKDIQAIELAGALKNAYAIGSGIIDGLGLSYSTSMLYLTLVFQEISKIYEEMGSAKDSLTSLAVFGDLVLSCTSNNSRNFTYGTLLGKNSFKAQEFVSNNTVEGYQNLKALSSLFESFSVDTPILDKLASIVSGVIEPRVLKDDLK